MVLLANRIYRGLSIFSGSSPAPKVKSARTCVSLWRSDSKTLGRQAAVKSLTT